MKRILLLSTLVLLFASVLMAQSERVEVVVHLKDGSTEEMMMDINYNYPWDYQKSIKVFDRSLVDEKKVKKKQKTKYKAKDVKGYEMEGMFFESKKVMITGRGDNSSRLKSLPGWAMIERVVDGEISVYKAYGYPPAVASGITFEEIYDELRSMPEYFMTKGDGKPKSMHGVNIEKWIKDASETSDRFAKGEFGNMKRKKKKGLGGFLKSQIENESPELIIRIVNAYNKEVSK